MKRKPPLSLEVVLIFSIHHNQSCAKQRLVGGFIGGSDGNRTRVQDSYCHKLLQAYPDY